MDGTKIWRVDISFYVNAYSDDAALNKVINMLPKNNPEIAWAWQTTTRESESNDNNDNQ